MLVFWDHLSTSLRNVLLSAYVCVSLVLENDNYTRMNSRHIELLLECVWSETNIDDDDDNDDQKCSRFSA